MPRPVVHGNGHLLVMQDDRGNLRDLCWPMGIWNHLSGRKIRTGFWVNGRFAWLDDPIWSVSQTSYGQVWRSEVLHIEVQVTEGLVGHNAWQRRMEVTNLASPHEVRVFVSQAPNLMESDIGDCAFLHADLGGIVHFKGHVAMAFTLDPKPDQFACGIIDFAGMEGTWRDAEDGHLGGNSIAQGSVDSTMGTSLSTGSGIITYTFQIAESVFALGRNEAPVPHPLPPPQECRGGSETRNVARSLEIMRTQISRSGAILAANDSDIMETNRANYSYCWGRDGAHIAEVFWDEGDRDIARKFLAFVERIYQQQPQPYLLQKYRADGSFGASWHPWFDVNGPITNFQQDETASVVSLAAKVHREEGLSQEPVNLLILRPLEFFLEFRENGLPKPSFDLWEERLGVHIYTVATVIHALEDGAFLDPKFRVAADEMRAAMLDHMVDPKSGAFYRRLDKDGQPDPTPDASAFFVELLGILPPEHEAVRRTADHLERHLWMQAPRAGMARYTGDYYFRVSGDCPGNPWIICTLWLAQHCLLQGQIARADWLLDWCEAHAAPTGVLPEQIHPETGAPLSVSPLTWSHAEYVKTVQWRRRYSS
jgi:GH15 family glucan-1,4-alpha-glucosidase